MKPMLSLTLMVLLLLPAGVFAQGRKPAAIQKPYIVESTDSLKFRCLEDDHGGFYLVWPHVSGAQLDLKVQHIDAQGASVSPDPGIPLITGLDSGAQWEAASDAHGGLLIAWEDDNHILAQRFGPDVKPIWASKDETLSASTSTQKNPVLDADGAGGAYVIWQEKRYPDRWVLMAQHINVMGALLWSAEGQRVSLRPSDQKQPRAVFDGSAGVIVAWQDTRERASQLQVQRLDFQGNRPWGLEGLLVTAPASDPSKAPYLGAVGGGAAVLAWQASVSAANRIFLQLADPSGKLGWDPKGIEVSKGVWDEWNPVLHGDGEGGSWVGWEDYRDHLNWQVYVQHYHVTGVSGWSNGETALAKVPADQGHLGITDDGQKGILAAWVDNRYGSVGVFLQEINGQGQTVLTKDGLRVADQLVNPGTPQIIYLAPDEVAVSWVDAPSKGTRALYWKRVSLKS